MTEVGFKPRQSGSRAHVLNDYTSKSLVKERVLLLLKEWRTIALREPFSGTECRREGRSLLLASGSFASRKQLAGESIWHPKPDEEAS